MEGSRPEEEMEEEMMEMPERVEPHTDLAARAGGELLSLLNERDEVEAELRSLRSRLPRTGGPILLGLLPPLLLVLSLRAGPWVRLGAVLGFAAWVPWVYFHVRDILRLRSRREALNRRIELELASETEEP